MASMAETIARLAAMRRGGASRLTAMGAFGPLAGFCHVPQGLPAGSALVLSLHGCTQDAGSHDNGTGWSRLADAQGFALLCPEQSAANNPGRCFNWFVPDDVRGGEAAAILDMVAAMVVQHRIDPARVFVTGLSAGGAMAMALLATAPSRFAAGAIIAGVPFGVARDANEAMAAMRGDGLPTVAELARRVRGASAHGGRWPRLAVWHGDADPVVAPANGAAMAAAWAQVQGAVPEAERRNGGHVTRVWRDAGGHEAVVLHRIAGMGHGVPVGAPGDSIGVPGPHMIAAGIDSTAHIAAFFGVGPAVAERVAPPPAF